MFPNDILDIGTASWLVLPLLGFIVGALVWGHKKWTRLIGYVVVLIFTVSRFFLEASTDQSPELDRIIGGMILFAIYYAMMLLAFWFFERRFHINA